MNLRRVNTTDLVIIGTYAFTLIMFLLNAKLGSIILLYITDVVVLGVIAYWTLRKDSAGMLRRSLIIGVLGGFLYNFIDSIFVDARIIFYMRSGDIRIPGLETPLSVVLYWMWIISFMIYLFQRLCSFFGKFYVPSLLTGFAAFISGAIFNALGSRIWVWNIGSPPLPSIAVVPLFVPTAFFITFFLSPYILGMQKMSIQVRPNSFWAKFSHSSQNPIAGGVRCALVLSVSLYALLQIFLRLNI